MSRRTDTMHRVAGMADDSADRAMQELARRQKLLDEGELQLADLFRFLREYEAGADAGTSNVGALLNRQRFLQRINHAIAYQQQAVERLRGALDEQRALWMQARNRAKALGSVAQHLQQNDDRAAERQGQRELDERAQRSKVGTLWDEE